MLVHAVALLLLEVLVMMCLNRRLKIFFSFVCFLALPDGSCVLAKMWPSSGCFMSGLFQGQLGDLEGWR